MRTQEAENQNDPYLETPCLRWIGCFKCLLHRQRSQRGSPGFCSNWLGPVWIIVNYFAWKALQRYSFHQEAATLADKTISLLASDLKQNGSLNEYYHPDTGAALSHTGFMDWNLLVLEMI